jgi:hypothetical protein
MSACELHAGLVEQIESIKTRLAEGATTFARQELGISALKEAQATITAKLNSIDTKMDAVLAIGRDVESLASRVNKLENKVGDLELKPARRYDGIVDKILLVLVGAIVAYFLTQNGIVA